MARCPFALWDPLGKQTESKMARVDIFCAHTMGGPFDVVNRMFHADGYQGVESHFGLRSNGGLHQWQDTDYQADANYDGNPRIISVETEDMGPAFPAWTGSNVPPWTDDQLEVLVKLGAWVCKTHDIPPVLVPDSKPTRRGLAYHRQGIDGNFTAPTFRYPGRASGGERWSSSFGKVCPGDRRIRQFIEEVVPEIARKLSPPDKDFIVVALKGDRVETKTFERTGDNFHEYIDRKAENGWRLRVRPVRDAA